MFRKLSVVFVLACSLRAADEPRAKPAISEKARGDFWKSAALSSQADAAKIAADNNKKTTVEAMQKECGDWELQQDSQTLEPVCAEKKAAAVTQDAQIDAQAKSKLPPANLPSSQNLSVPGKTP